MMKVHGLTICWYVPSHWLYVLTSYGCNDHPVACWIDRLRWKVEAIEEKVMLALPFKIEKGWTGKYFAVFANEDEAWKYAWLFRYILNRRMACFDGYCNA